MKKAILLFLVMFAVLVDLHAQLNYNIYVKNRKNVPLEGVTIYTFPMKKIAKAAYDEMRDNEGVFNEDNYNMTAKGTTDHTGLCIIKASSSGSILIDGQFSKNGAYKPSFITMDEARKKADGNTFEFILTDDEEGLPEVDVEGQLPMPTRGTLLPRHDKYTIPIDVNIAVPGEYARNDARFVCIPMVVFSDYKDSVVCLPPAVVQGRDYDKNMGRRMSYDVSRDKLHDYVFDGSLYLTNNQGEKINYVEYARITKGTKYYVPGIMWCEDYNTVYYKDSVLLHDGKETEPMRFLNWDAARKLSPVNREHFLRQGTIESVPMAEEFKLDFEVSRTELNLRDSVTLHQRDSMIQWLGKYYNGEAQIDTITVRGFSSPEGSESINRSLSRGRANTIMQLLKYRFPDVSMIRADFNEHDNIVPWEEVTEHMMQMPDTLAKKYAHEIRNIIADKTGFDAQNRVIGQKKDLYKYVKENVLGKVRVVQIEANVKVEKVLSKEEIIERYNSDPNFKEKMQVYQCYEIMCHLADKEDWDGLYDVSKRAYERFNKETVVKYRRGIYGDVHNPDSITDIKLDSFETLIPYPLAAYYYAVSCMRKGLVNTDILKPYLDEGKIGENEKKGLNSLPFIVAQVLMYCQDENFDNAAELLAKYNLESYPHLTGLVMFVRCLNGEYEKDLRVRNYVMSTSLMNKAVILCALGKYKEALMVLYSDNFNHQGADVEYLKAICHFQFQSDAFVGNQKKYFTGDEVYSEDATPGINTTAWAAPMLSAFAMDENNVRYIENDGYFNNAYRQMLLYFWERHKKGVPLERIIQEYRNLTKKMEQDEKQQPNNTN